MPINCEKSMPNNYESISLKAETLPLSESCRASAHRYEEVSGPLEEQAQQRAESSTAGANR
jgi:hypothetical protein